jgi:hypothetical protein
MKDVRFIWGLPQDDSCMKLKELVTVKGTTKNLSPT